jgi:predicted O-linked N-acetylglucosamine transferase (SPINDLY family)
MITTWKEPAYEYLLKQDYLAVAHYYEEALETEPENYNYYWYLGLAYLLLGQEDEAQATWLVAMSAGSPEEIETWTTYLIEILSTEAQRQESLGDYQKSWLIRGHLREIAPNLINNLLKLINLEIILNIFTPEKLNDWQVIELLQQNPKSSVDSDLLLQVLKKVLEFSAAETVAFARASLAYISSRDNFIEAVAPIAIKMANQQGKVFFTIEIIKLCLELQPNNLSLLNEQIHFYTLIHNYQQALQIAYHFYKNCQTLPTKIFGNYRILYTLIVSGNWQEVGFIAERHRELLREMISQQTNEIDSIVETTLVSFTLPWLYLQDNLVENRWFQNQISLLFHKNFSTQISASTHQFDHDANNLSFLIKQNKQLRIGYIAHTFRKHSVGWLARWLLHYHNREKLQPIIYLGSELEDEITQIWYKQKVDIVRNFQKDHQAIAQQIREDKIDILVDLDSVTRNITCLVMALKPAPVQVTWLGFDASGLPTIDYFIADPYVLPQDAQAHYTEKIWRLPHTYLAVDGFEIGIPTLRRDDLGIPDDAVIYLSSHGGYKRHPATIRLQMQIIKEVANSYLLIKGVGDEKLVKQLFSQIAEEEGVNLNRLKFLPKDPNEYTHRANLQIADIALDTYPYNGATTTLEILWMGIPLVTRVGEQFAARNSYTFLRNVGVEEGIAWTDEEYIEWGVRLGKDKALREEIAWKLQKSKQTAPLWNGKQFALEMEQAYQQMWSNYIVELSSHDRAEQ